ncbi:MAG: hypothetical protein QGF46_02755 [Planctomycetota bacterium]|jgi:hypothetical protein|nr:hypothetical protein [Planctomycetota bacterium]
MKKLIPAFIILISSVSCASGPATGHEGFEIRRTGLSASGEFWGKYFFNQDDLDPYIAVGDSSRMSNPSSVFGAEGSFRDQSYSHREFTAPLYEKESSYDLFKRWALGYDNSPYGAE